MSLPQIEEEEDYSEIMEQLEDQRELNDELREELDQQRREIKKIEADRVVMAKANRKREEQLTAEKERNAVLQKEINDIQEHMAREGGVVPMKNKTGGVDGSGKPSENLRKEMDVLSQIMALILRERSINPISDHY